MKKRPQELTNAVLALYGTIPAKEIASKFNISVYTVYNIYRASPNKVKHPTIKTELWTQPLPEHLHLNRKILSSDVAQIKAMYSRGISIKEIADHFSVSRSTIRYHLFPELRRRIIEANSKPRDYSKEQLRAAFKTYYTRKKAYLLETYAKKD